MNNELLSKTLNEKEAAQYVGMSVSFLQKDRMNGILPGRTHGPRYAKLGKRVVYLRDDLDAWLAYHLIDRS
ncbi:MAG: helix-turn-helix domain-containing protein [Coxiellaceae bacterium]|nr:helix-turn-helix domain-containing protein [Coxiellaceae bacterium]